MTLEEKLSQIDSAARSLGSHCKEFPFRSAFFSLETLAALYYNVMDVRPKTPDWTGRDRLIFAAEEEQAAYLSTLADRGYFSAPELEAFSRQPVLTALPGMDCIPASPEEMLSQAISLAQQACAAPVPFRCFFLFTQIDRFPDSLWKRFLPRNTESLSRLTVLLCTEKQAHSCTQNILLRFRDYRFAVEQVDGGNIEAITQSLEAPQPESRPRFLLCEK